MTTTQATEPRTHRTETAAEVVGRLRATFNTGVTRRLDWRVNQLRRLRALLVENEQELIEALWADLRKNAAEAETQEIDFTVADIDEALANLENWLQPRPVEVPAHFGPTTTAYTTYDPLGVVLVIAPWNFPLHLLIDPIIGALAAGNTVVAKPSEMSVHTSAVASRLLRQHADADADADTGGQGHRDGEGYRHGKWRPVPGGVGDGAAGVHGCGQAVGQHGRGDGVEGRVISAKTARPRCPNQVRPATSAVRASAIGMRQGAAGTVQAD
ncbi:aldehyde dehydrogenase family protein [Streptomyces sp. ME18-1-4]|uniref:aldehyde dehydrogenase family protein n=1 Tax=Streptomyces sp. ME18-1-4 TaxID=3028685 RepID=UPI0029BD6CA2|nr:aldehyde dehydrogenase family protein [Streptomyces sp. ME18-1-4]MDX3242221.1 aldehyde dehydrogenase family protein [Streptomyces sp. ME18-1-4]